MINITLYRVKLSFEENGWKRKLFSSFDLKIKKGEVVCLFGKSGSGKTTILKLISGVLLPTEGQVRLNTHLASGRHFRLGYVFQDERLFSWMTVEENISFVAKNFIKDSGILRKRIKESLRMSGIDHLAGKTLSNLSGGELQRISLARAISIDPEILLLDEPFGHLDQLARETLIESFLRIIKKMKMTTILVTHDPLEAVYLADRIVVIKPFRTTKIVADIKVVRKNKFGNSSYRKFYSHKANFKLIDKLIKFL